MQNPVKLTKPTKPIKSGAYPWNPYPWRPYPYMYPYYDSTNRASYGCRRLCSSSSSSSDDSSSSSDYSATEDNKPKDKKMTSSAYVKAYVPIINFTQAQIDEITAYVNNYRTMHQAPAMTWDPTIAKFSQSWSNTLLNNNEFKHSGNDLYGENIAYFQGYGIDVVPLIKQAIDMWYNEVKDYDFANPGYSSATGHFTCLVWKSSTSFGMGIAIDPTSQTVDITMNTSPPGNYIDQFDTNVFPATSPVIVPPTTPTPVVVPIVPPPPPPPPDVNPMPSPSADSIQFKAYNVINELNKNKSKAALVKELQNIIVTIINM